MSALQVLMTAAVVGGVFLAAGIVAWRPRRTTAAVHSEIGAASTATNRRTVSEMSRQVDDYRRDVELQVERQLTALDELILEADCEIARLEALLARQQPDLLQFPTLSTIDQQRCFELWESGLTVDETADQLQTSAAAVQAALDEWRHPAARAA